MPGEVVPQLHLDAELDVALGVEDALLHAHRARDDAAAGRYEEPFPEVDGTYQRRLLLGAANTAYALAYYKRAVRLKRMEKK